MKIEIKETSRLEAAEAEVERLHALMQDATVEVHAARLEASGLVAGRTMVEWKETSGRLARGVVVGLDRTWWPIARTIKKDGTLGEPRSIFREGRVLDETWEGETP